MADKIRIGTRKSLLARVQTRIVAEKLKDIAPETEIEIIPIVTEGDLRLDKSLGSFGGKGVFTKELEQALLDGRIHMAVHSAKDMPVDFPAGLTLGAVVERAEWEDMVVTADGKGLKEMTPGTVIGTGSLRRSLQLKMLNPGIRTKEIRGNVQTRLQKLKEGQYDAIVLARAGIERLRRDGEKHTNPEGIDEDFYRQFYYEILDTEDFLPAAGQAILAVEVSKKALEDKNFAEICRKLNQKEAEYQLLAERSFLKNIGGGCNAPVSAFSWLEGEQLFMKAGFAGDGEHMIFNNIQGKAADAEKLGEELAESLRMSESKPEKKQPGKVFLVGAGPGDAGLVTVRGLWCIRHADVIVYDYLASHTLLNEAGEHAELIYAGKQSGHHHMSQEEIQEILLEKAFERKMVVRLKGGDPFIFGRGGEEALALRNAEIPFEIVPGVSSAYSVPAYAGIPVTHRGAASQVHFITGHEQAAGNGGEACSVDYAGLAKCGGTLVFLMGIKRMEEICGALIQKGKDRNTPAAVIQDGTTGRQKEVTATLGTIVETCKKAGIQPPGILVIGEVAGLSEKLWWRRQLPLSGKRVILTGTRDLVRGQHQSLSEKGAEAIDLSLIYVEPAADKELWPVIQGVENYSWLVFTSSNGVALFFEFVKKFDVDYRRLAHLKFAVVGPGTGERLRSYGFRADYMPERYTSESLAQGLAEQTVSSDRVLVFRAEEGSKFLNHCFESKGIHYKDVAAYTTRVDRRKQDLLLRSIKDADYITFASGSAIRAFAEMTEGLTEYPKVICIGPVTAGEAEKAGLSVAATAEKYTIEGLTDCLCQLQNRE